MAYRSAWSGSLLLKMFPVPIEVVKGTEDPEGYVPLKRLCSCHQQPFSRPKDECPEGNHPWSQAAEDRGDPDLTEVVYGVQVGENKWEILDPAVLEEIADATTFDNLRIDHTYTRDEVPLHLAQGFYYLRPARKTAGSEEPFALLRAGLAENELVAVSEWSYKGSTRLVAIYPVVHDNDEVLGLSLLPYGTEVRHPDADILAAGDVQVDDDALEMITTILTGMQGDFDYSAFTDVGVEMQAKAVQAALDGKKIATPKDNKAKAATGDLMGALKASVKAVEGAPSVTGNGKAKTKATAKKKAAPKKAPRKRAKAKA